MFYFGIVSAYTIFAYIKKNMWKETKIIKIKGAIINELWNTHSDVSNWANWQENIEWTKVKGKIEKGTTFVIKPKGAPKVKLEIITFDKPSIFTDISYLPLAKMKTTTKMKTIGEEVEIILEIEMTGLLTFLWKKAIAKDILEGHLKQNEDMVKYIISNRNE